MACDKWDRVEDNLWALKLSIESIRGLQRWGGSEFLDGLFTGFKALPETTEMPGINYFSEFNNKEEARERYVELIKEHHPDHGGNQDIFIEIRRQYSRMR
jgi:hypothetical protein